MLWDTYYSNEKSTVQLQPASALWNEYKLNTWCVFATPASIATAIAR
jgi:hypothetical protein